METTIKRQRPEYFKEYRNKHKDRIRLQKQEKAKRNPENRLLNSARYRAKELNLPCTINLCDIHVPEVCPILKIPLIVGRAKQGPNSPSLDRINPLLGYIPDNIRVISYKANAMKQNATDEELVLFANWVLNRK